MLTTNKWNIIYSRTNTDTGLYKNKKTWRQQVDGTREEGRMTPMDNEEERQGFFIADETALKCMEDHIEKTESESTQEVFMKALSIM